MKPSSPSLVGETRGLQNTGGRQLRCRVPKSVIPRLKSNDGYRWSSPLLTWKGTASLHQIAQWRHVITTDHVFPFTDGHACRAQKLPWKNPCVVYLETFFTKDLLLRSPTIYTAALNHQKSYCTTGSEGFRPSPSAAWDGYGTLVPSRPPSIELQFIASCSKPETVGHLKSFIGACKVLARV